MKLISITVALALTVLAAATPAPEQVKRAVDCKDCKDRYQFCLDNGRTQGEEGCAKTCAQHVCYQTPECRNCGDELGLCPDVSRYHMGCGGKSCPR